MNDTPKSNKPKRAYNHFPPGTDTAKINDTNYTTRVQRRLKRDLNSILSFTHDWQIWLIRHPDYLPDPLKNSQKPVLKDPRLDRLLRLFIAKISETERFSSAERDRFVILVTDIYEKDGWIVDESIRQSINALFIGKVIE